MYIHVYKMSCIVSCYIVSSLSIYVYTISDCSSYKCNVWRKGLLCLSPRHFILLSVKGQQYIYNVLYVQYIHMCMIVLQVNSTVAVLIVVTKPLLSLFCRFSFGFHFTLCMCILCIDDTVYINIFIWKPCKYIIFSSWLPYEYMCFCHSTKWDTEIM